MGERQSYWSTWKNRARNHPGQRIRRSKREYTHSPEGVTACGLWRNWRRDGGGEEDSGRGLERSKQILAFVRVLSFIGILVGFPAAQQDRSANRPP
jgi:hypothetical protein